MFTDVEQWAPTVREICTREAIPCREIEAGYPGVTRYQGRYAMVFRNDYGSLEEQRLEGTNLGLAYSDDDLIRLCLGSPSA
jgi:beta-1,4-mannooligosaccharide/beta-1,4-mannosyl-N-acetylglucosamine phosphorylase